MVVYPSCRLAFLKQGILYFVSTRLKLDLLLSIPYKHLYVIGNSGTEGILKRSMSISALFFVADPGFPVGGHQPHGGPTPDMATFHKICMSKGKNRDP